MQIAREAMGKSVGGCGGEWCANVCVHACVCMFVTVHEGVHGCVQPHGVRGRKMKSINPILLFTEHLWSFGLKIIVELCQFIHYLIL